MHSQATLSRVLALQRAPALCGLAALLQMREVVSSARGFDFKAPRRIALGTGFSAAASAAAGSVLSGNTVDIQFRAPIIVAPGEFVAICTRKVTAAPATGAIMWSILFDAYYE